MSLSSTPHRGTSHPFVKNETLVFIDTITFFARFFPETILVEIAEITPNRPWLFPCQLENGFYFGALLILQQPSCAALEYLAGIQESYKIRISRLDVAFDFLSETAEEKQAKTAWLRAHALLRYRRKGWLLENENTLSWIEFAGGKKPSRHLMLYDDRPCKLGGRSHCTHLELRLYGSASVSRLGLYNMRDVMDLDPNQLFEKTIKLAAFDIDKFINRSIRKTYKGQLIKKDDRFAELWNSNLLKRLQKLYKKVFQKSAQRAKDILGYEKVGKQGLDFDILKMPKKLSWQESCHRLDPVPAIENKGLFREDA